MKNDVLRSILETRLLPLHAPQSPTPLELNEHVPMPIISPKDDLRHLKSPNLKPAAVLVPIVERSNGLHIVLTKRTAHLKAHAGQVSFPGGKWQESDANLVHTALRESAEEIGLHATETSVIGALPAFATGTGFWVSAYVGLIKREQEWIAEVAEVETIFEVPLTHVLQPDNLRFEPRIMLGVARQTYKLSHEMHDIWGATAYILHMLRNTLEQK